MPPFRLASLHIVGRDLLSRGTVGRNLSYTGIVGRDQLYTGILGVSDTGDGVSKTLMGVSDTGVQTNASDCTSASDRMPAE